jgi:hypothetical protein
MLWKGRNVTLRKKWAADAEQEVKLRGFENEDWENSDMDIRKKDMISGVKDH